MQLDTKTCVFASLILAVLASWGSRERTHTKRFEAIVMQRDEAMNSLTQTTQALTETQTALKRAQRSTETIEPVVLPNGQTAYVTRRTSETLEESLTTLRQNYEQKIQQTQAKVTELEERLKQTETETVKSAPMWNSVVEADLNQSYAVGAGINLGPFSISVINPLALEFRPRAALMLRF